MSTQSSRVGGGGGLPCFFMYGTAVRGFGDGMQSGDYIEYIICCVSIINAAMGSTCRQGAWAAPGGGASTGSVPLSSRRKMAIHTNDLFATVSLGSQEVTHRQ